MKLIFCAFLRAGDLKEAITNEISVPKLFFTNYMLNQNLIIGFQRIPQKENLDFNHVLYPVFVQWLWYNPIFLFWWFIWVPLHGSPRKLRFYETGWILYHSSVFMRQGMDSLSQLRFYETWDGFFITAPFYQTRDGFFITAPFL
jgi:hypothetical protein